jgi:hypothetical protein
MAQSNYNIPNDSAPAVRAQMNSVFQSIATNNSGTSAPSTTFPHQWWYDTTTNILKQRNAADSAWIDIGTFDQTGGTFSPAGVAQLTQGQAEDPASTVFGQVSGQRIGQSINANFNVSGSAPKYACRAWVNFNGTLASGNIRASGNVSSVTRTATGFFTANLATAMPDANYSVSLTTSWTGATGPNAYINENTPPTTSALAIYTHQTGTGDRNPVYVNVAIFR